MPGHDHPIRTQDAASAGRGPLGSAAWLLALLLMAPSASGAAVWPQAAAARGVGLAERSAAWCSTFWALHDALRAGPTRPDLSRALQTRGERAALLGRVDAAGRSDPHGSIDPRCHPGHTARGRGPTASIRPVSTDLPPPARSI